jgi:hypothetical protein
MRRPLYLLIALSLLLLASRAWAVVEAEMPLAKLVEDSSVILLAKFDKVDREKGRGDLVVERKLRGEEQLATMPVKLLGAAGGEGNPTDMLDRVDTGTTLVLFIAHVSPTEDQLFAYSAGSWFKLRGTKGRQFVQAEPYLRQTFHGETADLVKLLDDFTAGTGKLPELDKKVKAGLGPKLHESTTPLQATPVAADQVEIGPAWQDKASSPTSPISNYVVPAVLLAALVGLAIMITRSSPGGPA